MFRHPLDLSKIPVTFSMKAVSIYLTHHSQIPLNGHMCTAAQDTRGKLSISEIMYSPGEGEEYFW
jgi:hypothetical protein